MDRLTCSMVDLPDPHVVIGTGRDIWSDDDGTHELHRSTMDLLRDHGLARARLNPLWINTLTLIAGAAHELYVFGQYRDRSHGAVLLAASGDDAVRVVADRAVVIVEPISARWLATTLVDSLPSVPGARVRPVTITGDQWGNPDTLPSDPLAEPAGISDCDDLAEVLAAPRDAVHQIYAARRIDGQRMRSSPITAIDLVRRGRVLNYTTAGDDIVMTSGTPREMVVTINNTTAGLTSD
ncbi:ESX secretion-associated protein EspG [Amycolatopsis sp. NBC_01480]|uniref:ESX secretion-associated protein EspG n=1 Tax=Amycolatopsis sp. NBC_01480 TaxID=2903562 RepID=UPI002E2DBDA6|nr:ESX secretion-associated protein EspG [Amycolatopsis sp. NBC_01480]